MYSYLVLRRAVLLIPVALWAAAFSPAQTHADFAGVWKMDPARSESAHQDAASSSLTSTIVVRFNGDTCTMETTRREGTKRVVFHESLNFKLDDSETTGPGDGGVTVTGKAHWDGPKLVVETSRNVKDATVTTLYVHSLSPDAREMTIDKTLTVQHGYQGMGASPAGHGRDIFVRVGK